MAVVVTGNPVVMRELAIKRCYLPGVTIASTCPYCGEIVEQDLGHDYLSHPAIGKTEEVHFYCECDGCDDEVDCEWHEHIVIEMTIRAATAAEIKRSK